MSCNDFFIFYLSLELYGLSVYGFISLIKSSLLLIEASIKYFIISSISSGLIIFGISLLYYFTGSIDFYNLELFIYGLINLNFNILDTFYLFLGINFIFLGLFIKLSTAPFHI